MFYYISIAFYEDLTDRSPENTSPNSSNTGLGNDSTRDVFCYFISPSSQTVISFMDFINLIAIPFTLMITFSILLVRAIFVSRQRVMKNYTNRENKTFQRDIKLAATSISINLIYLILNLPLAVIDFSTNFTDFIFMLCFYGFLASYAVNFYIILLTNTLFQRQLIGMCRMPNYAQTNPNRSTFAETTNNL